MRCALILASSLALIGHTTAQAATGCCQPKTVTDWELGQIFNTYVTELYVNKNVTAAFEFVTEDYVQHNPFVGQGAQAAIDLLSQLVPPLNISIYHLAFDQGIGWIHWRGQGGYFPVETAIVDIVRFNGSCVQEHWDVIESLPANATNSLALF